MNIDMKVWHPKQWERFFSVASVGLFFILAGTILATTPNLFDKAWAFFRDFDLINVPRTGNVVFPAPKTPSAHSDVYAAVGMFSLIWGFFEIALAIGRFIARSPLDKRAENVSNVAFWFGTYYLINTYLDATTTRESWFIFWSTIIILIGITLIIRAIVLAIGRATHA